MLNDAHAQYEFTWFMQNLSHSSLSWFSSTPKSSKRKKCSAGRVSVTFHTIKHEALQLATCFQSTTNAEVSLRLWQQTFGNATTGFPAKWRLRNERRHSMAIMMTRHYPDLGSASDWLNQIFQAARPIRRTTQIWVVTVISMEFLRSFLRSHLAGKPVVASPNVDFFLRLRRGKPTNYLLAVWFFHRSSWLPLSHALTHVLSKKRLLIPA